MGTGDVASPPPPLPAPNDPAPPGPVVHLQITCGGEHPPKFTVSEGQLEQPVSLGRGLDACQSERWDDHATPSSLHRTMPQGGGGGG